MARHQIIYTSCMRGIDGVNDGQQIYSYDVGFTECKSDDVKSLFTYQIPSLPPGVVMTEELATTMPSAFTYRFLSNGTAAVVLNTYLGRDYMGSAGRFGNYLSHAIVCDFCDMDVYPCELYGGAMLRKSMAYEEVNNPEPPKHLPEAVLEKGYKIDIDNVIEFLGIGDNMSYFKQMVAALLLFPEEKRRIVICDEPENVIMWIAALQYALPLDIAKRVNFTTYEFDPELSRAQICGVLKEGSRYEAANYVASGNYYVFDFLNNQFNQVSSNEALIDFLDTAFSFSYDSLTEFHEFVITNTTYRKVDKNYYAAYSLYSLLTDGLSEIKFEQFGAVVQFVEEFTTRDMRRNVAERIIEDAECLNCFDEAYAVTVLQYLLQQMPDVNPWLQDRIKGLLVNRILVLVSDENVSEQTFLNSYNTLDTLARGISMSIPSELMGDKRNELLNVMAQNVAAWKVYYIIRIISEYVMDKNMSEEELLPVKPIGNLYAEIIRYMYTVDAKSGIATVDRILQHFKAKGRYYVNIALNMEGFLKDLALEEVNINHLWNNFIKYALELPQGELEVVNTTFLQYERFEEMFLIYCAKLKRANDFDTKREIFYDTLDVWFRKSLDYEDAYAAKVVSVYEKAFLDCEKNMSEEDSYKYAKELLHTAMDLEVQESYVDDLIMVLTEAIPLDKFTKEHEQLITEMRDYQTKVRKEQVKGKLLLFCIGMSFEKIICRSDIKNITSQIMLYADVDGANLAVIRDKEVEAYLEWVMEKPLKYSPGTDDYEAIYDLFKMSRKHARTFMELCNGTIYKKCKDLKVYKDYAEFLKFMFEKGTSEDIDHVGKFLSKLSKQKLEEMDESMKGYFAQETKAIEAWEEVRKMAGATNPLLSNITGFFKRKKD